MSQIEVHRTAGRCSAEDLASLEGLATSILSDVLGRSYGPHGLARIGAGTQPLLGTAVTVRTRPDDNLAVHYALDLAGPGDVVVVDAGGYTEHAVMGEIMFTHAASRGIGGVVVDGAVRDTECCSSLPYAVYAKGTSHLGPYKTGPGAVNRDIVIGRSVVRPGDAVVGDADGVIVLPRELVGRAAEAGRALLASEGEKIALARQGKLDRGWVARSVDVVEIP